MKISEPVDFDQKYKVTCLAASDALCCISELLPWLALGSYFLKQQHAQVCIAKCLIMHVVKNHQYISSLRAVKGSDWQRANQYPYLIYMISLKIIYWILLIILMDSVDLWELKLQLIKQNLQRVVILLVRSFHEQTADMRAPFISLVSDVLASKPQMLLLERMVGVYEKICSNLRISMDLPSMNDIMHIKMNMPALTSYDIRVPIQEWMQAERKPRKKFDMTTTKQEEYYRGFFSEAQRRQVKVLQPEDGLFEELKEIEWE